MANEYAGNLSGGQLKLLSLGIVLTVHVRASLGLGYVPQTQNVFAGLSVYENLVLGAYEVLKGDVGQELDRVLHLFPRLKERSKLRAGNLSGGERRMLSLAAVLMMRPQCLLLDEPTSDLAPAMIGIIFEKIRDVIREYHIPVLLVEQNVRQALGVADRVLVLIQGKTRLLASARDLSEAQLGEVFLEA